jgi:hypothetical protein
MSLSGFERAETRDRAGRGLRITRHHIACMASSPKPGTVSQHEEKRALRTPDLSAVASSLAWTGAQRMGWPGSVASFRSNKPLLQSPKK